MLETIIQRLLGRYLEPYVYNLSRENLRLGVLSGNLVLENLKLKENLGDILNLPLTIDSGKIGHVSITIPWTSLGYKPLVIKLKGIHIVAKPKDYGDLDEKTLRKELRESKEKLIEYREKCLNERFINGELINANDNSVSSNFNNSSEKNSESNTNNKQDENGSANGTNLLWRIIKKIVANVQIEIQDIHICMIGFQSNVKNGNLNLKNSNSDIILGIMIKSGFVVTTDSSGNKNFDISSLETKSEDPNALFKTVEINDVGLYIGQYFPNSLNLMNNKPKKDDNSPIEFNLVNVNSVRDILYEDNNNKETNNVFDNKTSDILESKYLIVYDEINTKMSLGAWRLEFILKPLTFKLNVSHSQTNNELKGILQVHSVTEHTIIIRRSHLRPIIFSLQSLNIRQEKYREILLKDSHLVMLDPISLRTTTQDEYISLYSRKLKLEAIKLYNSDGNENNFFGIIINPLSQEELTRLQILDDVICVRNIAKWRCKAREIINRIIIEASSRKKLRNLSSDTKSLQMEKGNLIVNNEMVKNLGINTNGNNNVSWTTWAVNKITGRNNNSTNRTLNNSLDASSPSYLMQQRGITSNNDFTVSSNNALITEEEMDVIMTAVTNEKYFEKIETPTKFSITFGLAYFGMTIFDDVSKPIIHKESNSDMINKIDVNDINMCRNITVKFIESIPNPTIDSTFLTLKLHELYIQFNIHSVIDRNDKDSNEWNFSTYVGNLALNHYDKKVLFFDKKNNDIDNVSSNSEYIDNNSKLGSNKDLEKNRSMYYLGSLIRSFSDSFGFDNSKNIKNNNANLLNVTDYYLNNSSIFLHLSHNVNNDGNSLKLMLKVSPIEIFITPHFVLDLYSLLYLYNSIILISNNVSKKDNGTTTTTTNNNNNNGNNNNVIYKTKNFGGANDHNNYLIDDKNEFVENLIEKGNSVKYLSQNNSFPDFLYFDIEILSPVIHILCSNYEDQDNSLSSIQFILGNCHIKTKSLCEFDELDFNIELSNTQVKYLTYIKTNNIKNGVLNGDNCNDSIIGGLELDKEFTILHPIPVLINTNIHNQRKEEIGSEKDNLYIYIMCNLQQFILTVNNETVKYILHIPLSFYNVLSFPNILGYYYLPPDTLKLVDAARNTESDSNLLRGNVDTRHNLNKDGNSKNGKLEFYNEQNISNEYLGSGKKIASDVLILMNKTLKIDCYTKTDILSFRILSDSGNIDILQGSIKSISSCFSYDSVDSVYRGKVNLNRALLTSSYTKKPLLLVVTDSDPLIDNLSVSNGNNRNNEKKRLQFNEISDIDRNNVTNSCGLISKENNIQENSFESDNLFEDAIEEYDSTLEIFFEYNNKQKAYDEENLRSDEECDTVLNISLISSPIELYWDKPTILSLIGCIKSYQEGVYRILVLHMETLGRIYLLNKFYNQKIECNLIDNSEITSIYGNSYKITSMDDFLNIQSLILMRSYLLNIKDNNKVECLNINKDNYNSIWMNELKHIVYHLGKIEKNNNNWIYSIILMPPRFNYLHIQNVYLFLNNINNVIEYSSQTNDINSEMDGKNADYYLDYNFKIYSNIRQIQDEIKGSCKRERMYSNESLKSNSGENNNNSDNVGSFNNEASCFGVNNIRDYYQKYMFSGLFDSGINEEEVVFDNENVGLPDFSFSVGNRINKIYNNKPKIKFTYIIKGGSLTFIKDEKVYVTIGISNICICFDLYNTGDKKIKFSVNNCSFIINNKCILSRYNKSDKPLLLMHMNVYKSLSNSERILFGNELNIALKCYMDSLCYIIYYKDVLEFIDYINDGILDTLISKSYKAAKDITSKKVLLYYFNINNSVIKLPEDHEIVPENDYTNPKDVFDEAVQHYKDTLHDLLQEMYFDSVESFNHFNNFSEDRINVNENGDTRRIQLERMPSDDLRIPNYLLERISNRESLILLEKSISDYPRFKNILYDINLFEKTQSYCEISTKNIKIFNKMINNTSLIKRFYSSRLNNESSNIEISEINVWITRVKITDGTVDIVECKENNGSDEICGRILENVNSEIEFGVCKYFPTLLITRMSNNKKIELIDNNISLLNINLSPLAIYLSRQQLTFIINVITENFSNKNERTDKNSRISNNSLISINISRLSLETSFSHFEFNKIDGYRSTSMPLSLLTLFECKVRSNILKIKKGDSSEYEKYIKFSITSKKYYFDDIRLITNSKYRRILNGGFELGRTAYDDELMFYNYDLNSSNNNELFVNELNKMVRQDWCSIQFIFESSNIYGNRTLLRAFNPKIYIGFNCIIDFYYYLSHGFRSSFSRVENNLGVNKNNYHDCSYTKENDLPQSLLFRDNKENIMREFKELMKIVNKLEKLKFEFRLEVNNGFFGFVTDPQKTLIKDNLNISNDLILILEANINCSITSYLSDTIVKNLDLLDCVLYFTEIDEKNINNKQTSEIKSRLLKPILNINSKYKAINFDTPNIVNENNKVVIANSFDIKIYGKYCSNIRKILDVYTTPISLGELILVLNIKEVDINITPYLLSVLFKISKKIFSDGPSISPLYTSGIKDKYNSKTDGKIDINDIDNDNYESGITDLKQNEINNHLNSRTKNSDLLIDRSYVGLNSFQGPPPIRRIHDIKISIEKINLKIINELNELKLNNKQVNYGSYLPIINFEISLPEWRIETAPLKTNHILLDASLRLNILDINNQIWEPIIEKCTFSIYYFYDHLILYDPYVIPTKKSLRKYFHSTFSKSLLINIKPSICSAIMSFLHYYNYLSGKSDVNKDIGIYNDEMVDNYICSKKTTVNDLKIHNHFKNSNSLSLNDMRILDLNKLSKLREIDNSFDQKTSQVRNNLRYINLTGYPYYCFTLIEENNNNGYKGKITPEYCLNQLLLLLPSNKVNKLNFNKNGHFMDDKILLKNINNCNSKIPLLRVSLSNKMLCLFSAPIDKDIMKLKKEFENIDIEHIIRVMIVYKSYDLSKKLLNYYKNVSNNQNDMCSNIVGPLPNGLSFTNYNENIVSSASIDTIIPYHNLHYLKDLVSNNSETYKRLFSTYENGVIDEIKSNGSNMRDVLTSNQTDSKLLLNRSIGKSISRSLSKSSIKSLQNGIKKNLERKFYNSKVEHNDENKDNEENYLEYNNHYHNSYKNVLGEIISMDSVNKLFCIISNNRIINRSGIPIEICFLSDDNVPIQLFDISNISVEKDVCDVILNHEVLKNQYKYSNNNVSKSDDNTITDSEFIDSINMNCNELKTIPTWLNNNDIINTIMCIMNDQIYNSEDDVTGIIECNGNSEKRTFKSKRIYYTYFLPNNCMLSVPQIALLNNNCNVIFRPSIIGLFEMYSIYTQYNNDNDIEQMLLDSEIYSIYVNLMSKYNSEENMILNDKYFYDKIYELLKLFKTSNGEFILDLYYTFWNNMIIKFSDNNKMDLSYLYSRGWIQNKISTCNKNVNKTYIHASNVYSDYKYLIKKNVNSHNNNCYNFSKENSLYFQSYIQGYQSLFPGNISIKNVFIYPGFSIFNLMPTLIDLRLKSLNSYFLPKTSSLLYKLKPFYYYNIYQFSGDSKLQMKTRISLDYVNYENKVNFCSKSDNDIESTSEIDSLYTKWSSTIDLNMNETESSFTLYNSDNNSDACNIDIQYFFMDKLNKYGDKYANSVVGLMQKNVLAFNLCTWFINKTQHNIIPIYENTPYPYINVDIDRLYVKSVVNDKNKEHKIYLLNNRHNYLKIYFDSIESIRNKYKEAVNEIDNEIYNKEVKTIFGKMNSSNRGYHSHEQTENSNIGLLEIPSSNNTYSFPIINENKVYYFTVKNNSLFYNNLYNSSFNSRIIVISPHILLCNSTKRDRFFWYSITFPNVNSSQNNNSSNNNSNNNTTPSSIDVLRIDPNNFISKKISCVDECKYKYSISDLNIINCNETNNVVSNNIDVSKLFSNSVGDEYDISIKQDNNNNNSNGDENSTIKSQHILLYFSRASILEDNVEDNDFYFGNKIRWSRPIVISSESNGIYYISIPNNQDNSDILTNPNTYCIEITNSGGLFMINIKEYDSVDNLWDGVIFTNYCDYLSRINIETYHFEYDIEAKKKRLSSYIENSLTGKSLNSSIATDSDNIDISNGNNVGISGCRNNDLVLRYIIKNNNTNNPMKITWSSPFVYTSRNCRLFIIPKLDDKIENKNKDSYLDNNIGNISSLYGIMAFDLNFNYNNHNNPYQSKRYILSLPESDIIKLCDMYPYLNSDYFLNNDITKGSKDSTKSYPIAIISIITRKNGLYVDVLPPRNHSSLLINLMKKNSLLLNRKEDKMLNNNVENYHLEDIYQERINEINKLNNDLWYLIYTYYRKITIDISQIGISIISEIRESEILYIELSTIQFRKQERNKNGLVDSYRFIIGDIQIDNQYIKSNSKCLVNSSNAKYYSNSWIGASSNELILNSTINTNTSSGGIIPYVLLGNKINENINSSGNNNSNGNIESGESNVSINFVSKSPLISGNDSNCSVNPFLVIKWSCSNARSQWDTNIYDFECELSSDLELNFDFNIYKIINEFIDDCKNYYCNLVKDVNYNNYLNNNGIYILNMINILSKKHKICSKTKPKTTFSIDKIKISSINLFVWCSIPLFELNYLPEWFRIGLKILTVSNALELRGAPIKLESHNINNLIGTLKNIFNVFYEYYMAELLWRIGTVLGHSSFVNIPLVPLQIGKNTLNMAFSTISIVNSNIINLLSSLTLDSEYINSRQRERTYNSTSNSSINNNFMNGIGGNYYTNMLGGGFLNSSRMIQDLDNGVNTYRTNVVDSTSGFKKGFAQAGHNLTQGLLSLGNFITKPIEGAQKNGFTGFCSGLIKGVTSSVVKPIDHIGQALNNVIDGIQAEVNKPLGGYKQKVMRRRIPRMLYSHHCNIKDYNINDALLKEIIGYNLTKNLIQYFLIPTNHFDMPLVLLLYPKKIALVKLIASFTIEEYYSSCIKNGYSSFNVTRNNSNAQNNNGIEVVNKNIGSGNGATTSSFDFNNTNPSGNLDNISNSSFISYGSNSNNCNYKSKLLWIVNIEDINEIKASSHGLIIEISYQNKNNTINDSLQIPICKFSLINEINVALDNSQNNASPHLIFKKN
ncbi:hypothetical protein FG379_000216 [Cryptosporidium bovis]|uniref:uncharacterized protein n=1 Tax=Cryptosporidium bovis TaxID=310047 RepID=UPI00351A4405|nr:hypothetical protein FG379_000216 [Cryptosporidium bovis]